MKNLILVLALLFATTALAKQVELKITTTYKSGDISTKANEIRLIANMDTEFNIPTSKKNPFNLKLNVSELANKKDAKQLLKFKGAVSILDNGKMKQIAAPEIITMVGNEATISTKDEDGTYFEMKVLAVKTAEKL